MTKNYYDAVVIGMELGPLIAGALLAKRGFRVLVAGQDAPADRYQCYGYTFTRRPFLLTACESPAYTRVITELGAGQLYQQLVSAPRPAYQVVLPRARLDVSSDLQETEREISREFPRARVAAPALLRNIGRLNGEIDKLIGNDLVIPPESFLERRAFSRAEVQNPFRNEFEVDLFPDANPEEEDGLREFLEAPSRLAAAGVSPVPPLVYLRQIGGWLFSCSAVEEGRDGLRKLLTDRIVGNGGDLQPQQRVAEINVRKGHVVGVSMAGREEMTGCQVVLSDLSLPELSTLIASSAWTKRFRILLEESPATVLGYGINLGIDREAVPPAMAHTVLLSLGQGMGDRLLRIEQIPQDDPKKATLYVSCVVPASDQAKINSGALRDAMLDRIRWLVPFLDNHLRVLHSPYDEYGPLDLEGDAGGEAPPVPYSEEIARWLICPPRADKPLGIENLPHRTGIKGLFLAGNQVIAGLDAEGDFIAGWGAARIAGGIDPRRERLVRSMRAKVEV